MSSLSVRWKCPPMETFMMSRKEVPRAGLLKAALAGRITNAQGARALRLSVRQFRRLKKRFREGGAHQPDPHHIIWPRGVDSYKDGATCLSSGESCKER